MRRPDSQPYAWRVRGVGDQMTVGERIAFYRQRRNLTQAVLAGMVGRSEDWLSKIERGDRQARRLDVLADLARELRITLGDLLGEPVLAEDDGRHDNVPAIRDVLMAPRRLSRVLYRDVSEAPPPPIAWAQRHVEASWREYQTGRVGRVIDALPELIANAQRLEDSPGDGQQRRQSWAISARTHHLAATTLSKVGEADLGWIAAERAMHAADQSEDPLALASAARAATHALLASGRYVDALDLGMTAADWLHDQVADGDPAALSLIGMLHLRTAVAAARNHDRSTATDLLRRATDAAQQLGVDANHWQTSFGPTNVEFHRVAASVDLGDVSYVVEHGDVPASHMPVERRAGYLIDRARAFAYAGRDEKALQHLLDAEREAPTLVRQDRYVRETVKTLLHRSPVTGGRRSSELFALAERCRAVA
jgi:transcriptional regulator with XRE-family HTH domain